MRLFHRQSFHTYRPYWFICIALCIVLSVLASLLYFWSSFTSFPKGLSVAHWDIGGMEYKEFESIWNERFQQLRSHEVELIAEHPHRHTSSYSFNELGIYTQLDDFIRAITKLQQGSLFERFYHRWHLRNQDFTIEVSFQEETVQQVLDATWPHINQTEPIDAVRTIDGYDQVKYEAGSAAYRIHYADLIDILSEGLDNISNWPTSNDTKSLVTLPLRRIEPKVTLENFKKQKINRKIVEFSTTLKSAQAGRYHNIKATAETIHNQLFKPKAIFDFAKVVETTEQQTGYQEAPVILNGKLVKGVGGGICQVSTTLYNAALLSGLPIIDRKNHSIPVSYVALGRDATFATGYINFRFQNHEQSHLLIRTELKGNKLTIKLFGELEENVSYQLHTDSIETIEPHHKYVYNSSLQPGKKQIIQAGKSGYKVKTSRIQLKDGKEIQRELLSEDRYPAKPTIIETSEKQDTGNENRNSKNPEKPRVIEDGVSAPIMEEGSRTPH